MYLPEVQQDAEVRAQEASRRRPAVLPDAAQRVTIVGAGYVGLNTGAVLAHLGHQATLVERVAAGQSTV